MSNEEVLQVHAYNWEEKDKYGDDDHVAIRCWALDKNSKPHLIVFNTFPAFCHLELPYFVRNNPYVWRKTNVDAFMKMVAERLGGNAPDRYTFKEVKKTYYYRMERKTPMIHLCFKSLEAMRKCSYMFSNPLKTEDWGFIKCNIWENGISMIRKLLTVRKVKFCQWFSVVGVKVESELRVSTLETEYIGYWDTMEPIPQDVCKNWVTKPGMLALDIECYSDNPRAMPDKLAATHVAYMISCIYQKYRSPETRKRYGIVIGDCDVIPPEKLKNCKIITVTSEIELVTAFGDVILETDPEILIGYNILNFDYPYLDHRTKRTLNQWPRMGRIMDEIPYLNSKQWKSSAYGFQDLNTLEVSGRISIDLLPIVKRDYKLPKYDLNTVCKKFLGKTKHDVKVTDMFITYENSKYTRELMKDMDKSSPDYEKSLDMFTLAKRDMTKVMEYCIQDSELVIELMDKLNVWIGLVEMSNIVGVTIVQLFSNGQQMRCVSQLYDLAANSGYILDSRENPSLKFVGAYVHEPIPGLFENIICLDFASLYPSIIMAYNICYTTLVPTELMDIVPDDQCNVIEFDQEEPLIIKPEKEEEGEKEELEKEKKKKEEKKTVIRHYKFKFYKQKEGLLPKLVRNLVAERSAVRKQIEQNKEDISHLDKMDKLLTTEITLSIKEIEEKRADVKGEIAKQYYQLLIDMMDENVKAEKLEWLQKTKAERKENIDTKSLLNVVLDKRQLAIKVSANSFFGFLGVQDGGKMPLIEGAMSITAKGRELIGLVRKYLSDKYNALSVYGDTDCVRGHTPVFIRDKMGKVDYIQIKDLVELGPANGEKQYYDLKDKNIEVWTEKGWSKIIYLMRHKTTKQFYRVSTHTGIVDVSEDHSLLNEKAEEVTPTDVKVGMKLLHNDLPNIESVNTYLCVDKAWVWGFMMAEGTCGKYKCKTGNKSSWSISNQNQDFLKEAQRCMRKIEPDYDFVIYPCMKSSNVDKLTATGDDIVGLALKYHKLFYTERSDTVKQNIATNKGIRYKKIPQEIFTAPNYIKEAFLSGWYDGDGCKCEGKYTDEENITTTINKETTKEELGKKTIKDIQNYLKSKNINFSSNDKKGVLIQLVTGEIPRTFKTDPKPIEDGEDLEKRTSTDIREYLTSKKINFNVRSSKEKLIKIAKGEIQPPSRKSLNKKYIKNEKSEIKDGDDLKERTAKEIREYLKSKNIKFGSHDSKEKLIKISKGEIVEKKFEGFQGGYKLEWRSKRFDIKGQIGAAGLYYICTALGYKVSLYARTDKTDIYRLNLTMNKELNKDPNVIKTITPLGVMTEDVFDLETENHHFGAGVGRMIVHNSIMFSMPCIKEAKECDYWGNRLAEEISGIKPGCKDVDGVYYENGRAGLFPPPLSMEFEKAMRLLCFKKKKYAALLITKSGKFKEEEVFNEDGTSSKKLVILTKGIVLARRDNCKFLRDMYTDLLERILVRKGLDETFTVMATYLQKLLDGQVKIEDLLIIRELGANYKSDSFFMKVFSDNLKRAGKIVNPGDRLDFLIVAKENEKLLGNRMLLLEQYRQSQDEPSPERVDYNYYIEKVLMNPINQLMYVGFKADIDLMPHITYKPSNRHKPIGLDKMLKIIIKMIERKHNITILVNDVCKSYERIKKGETTTINELQDTINTNSGIIVKTSKKIVTERVSPKISFNIISKQENQPILPKISFNVISKQENQPLQHLPKIAFNIK